MKKDKKDTKQSLNKKQKVYAIIAMIVVIIAITSVIVILLFKKNDNEKELEPINENFSFILDEKKVLLPNDDRFASQYKLRNDYMDKYKKGNYDIKNPLIIKNPFLLSPQSALVMFKTNKKETITATIKGKHNDDLIIKFEASKDHYLPIYGLYGGYENEVVIETESGQKNTIKIKVDEVCDTAKVDVITNNITNSNGEFYFGTSSFGAASVAYDNYGEVRWWLNLGYTKGMTMLQNGHILLSSVYMGPDFTSTSGVVELDMMGYLHQEYEVEGGYHHDGHELKNGNLIILTSNLERDLVADHVVELDRNTGKVVKEWNLYDIVTSVDSNAIEDGDYTWGWINSVTYDDTTKSLVLSLRNRNSVISIDYESGKINWILGNKKYWTNKFDEYLLKGIGENFIYPSGQHSVNITKEGYLSIFNNGYNANKERAVACKNLKNNESYAMIYKLDLEAKTAEEVWKFGGKEYFSYALSSLTYDKDNHKIFNSGWHFTDEVNYEDPECTQFSNDKYETHLIEFNENNEKLVELNIKESKFEVVKAPIYNLAAVSVNKKSVDTIKNYDVELGAYLTSFESDKYVELSENEAVEYINSEELMMTFQMYNKRFKLHGSVPDDMEFKVVFISPRGRSYAYLLKEKNKELKEFINVSALPKGRYYIYVTMGDLRYNTLQYINIE